MVAAGAVVARAGGRLVIANALPKTGQLLIMTGLLTHFPVFESEEGALAFFRQPEAAWAAPREPRWSARVGSAV
jgi:hypothetical protein